MRNVSISPRHSSERILFQRPRRNAIVPCMGLSRYAPIGIPLAADRDASGRYLCVFTILPTLAGLLLRNQSAPELVEST
jgi:hypothetical protein